MKENDFRKTANQQLYPHTVSHVPCSRNRIYKPTVKHVHSEGEPNSSLSGLVGLFLNNVR